MEEDKVIKRKKTFRLVGKILSYFLITILMIVAAFLIVYVVVNKISEKKGEYPPFSLYTIISPSMEPNINVYDVVFIRKAKPENLKVGDVIEFYSSYTFVNLDPQGERDNWTYKYRYYLFNAACNDWFDAFTFFQNEESLSCFDSACSSPFYPDVFISDWINRSIQSDIIPIALSSNYA